MDQQKREDLRVDDVVFLIRMTMGRHSDDLGGLAWGPVPLGRLARCGGIFFGHENNRAAGKRVAACEAIGPAGTSVVKAASAKWRWRGRAGTFACNSDQLVGPLAAHETMSKAHRADRANRHKGQLAAPRPGQADTSSAADRANVK